MAVHPATDVGWLTFVNVDTPDKHQPFGRQSEVGAAVPRQSKMRRAAPPGLYARRGADGAQP